MLHFNYKQNSLALMALALTAFPMGAAADEKEDIETESVSPVTELADTTKTAAAANNKKVENRNVMLNAESSTMPRTLNIGLPFNGDILIMENDLPVVYTYWTQMPTTVWNYDSSLGGMGVMSFAEGALTFGKVGYIVTSTDRTPGRKFHAQANINLNSNGTTRYDATVSGPMGKKGWGYMLSLSENYDRGNDQNYHFYPYAERAEHIKAGISKRYKNGSAHFVYKYSKNHTMNSSYNPWIYDGDGKTSKYPGFSENSTFLPVDGMFPYYDFYTGEQKEGDMASNESNCTESHTFYLHGEHKFSKKTRLTWSGMYMTSKVAFTLQYPLSMNIDYAATRDEGTQFFLRGTDQEYTGDAVMVSAQYYPQARFNTVQAHTALYHKVDNHNLRLGATFQYFKAPITFHSGVYYQTMTDAPQILDWSIWGYPITNNGLIPSEGMGGFDEKKENKTALYASDDFTVGKWLTAGIGGRIELQNNHNTHNQYENQFLLGRQMYSKSDNGHFNGVLTGNFVAKVNREFGFVGEATWNSYYNPTYDYSADQRDANGYPLDGALTDNILKQNQQVLNLGGGVYWNNKYFSLVSKITHISKDNNVGNLTAYNPDGSGESVKVTPIIYKIKTFGWTTDVIATPFKNFQCHFLLTLQNPKYKDYSCSAYGQTYDYSDKVIPELSKVLVEIDPSLYLMKRDLRLWASFRYFGKQYSNLSNAFEYNGWWESFAGIDYKMNRNVSLKLQMVNLFNQSGVKGSLIGAEQITDASPYVGRPVIASRIRPRCLEFTATFNY